ncbi:hypothetical protein RvY_02142 [Ramazzottius varieornatus]|uniref:Uncharacterized protein n=1 Tax=Ramazzottius varieornatus TaxID=947166 RepID=A0A1D1UM34_RAMVA|nr:hypothetical protein RvY_02142 [Ramazzottius varieornatus]
MSRIRPFSVHLFYNASNLRFTMWTFVKCRILLFLVALLVFALADAARTCMATGTPCTWRPEISMKACCSGMCNVQLGQEEGVCT